MTYLGLSVQKKAKVALPQTAQPQENNKPVFIGLRALNPFEIDKIMMAMPIRRDTARVGIYG